MTKREQELLDIALEVLKLNDGRGLDEIGLYDDNPKNHGYER